jgi:pyroglutamyl-peptidase
VSRVLITGFEPFDGAQVNASWEAVRLLADDFETHLLPCVYGAALDVLWSAVERVDPDVVLCAGLAGGRAEVAVERVAINVDDARIPDNAGAQPIDRPIVAGGPAAYFATIPVKACVAGVRALGVPVNLSNSAGTFVCNHVFYGLLHRAATMRPGLRGGFVHVPELSVLPAGSVAAALRSVAVTAAERRDDVALAEGTLH